MDTVRCGHCNGSGQEFDRLNLDTGEVHYRSCHVCAGSGEVASDRAFYSGYPDVSLRNAQQLISQHGKVVEVSIASNDDFTVTFGNGRRFVLGGFTVGYRGTGPDFAKRFLDAAGFNISMDEIADMQKPVTLTTGTPYLAPQSLQVHAETLIEAKRLAVEAVPPGAEILSLEDVHDGETVLSASEPFLTDAQAAYEKVRSRLPQGALILEERVKPGRRADWPIEAAGPDKDSALKSARTRLPIGGIIDEEKVYPKQVTVNGQADSEADALKMARALLPEGAVVEKQEIVQSGVQRQEEIESWGYSFIHSDAAKILDEFKEPKITAIEQKRRQRSGLFGIGDRIGIYRVTWQAPWIIRLTYSWVSVRVYYNVQEAVVDYRPQPEVKVTYRPAQAEAVG